MNISCTNKMKRIYPKYISKLLIPVLSAGALFGFGCSPSKKVVEVPKVSLEEVVHYDYGDLNELNVEDGFFKVNNSLTRVNVCDNLSLSDTRVNDWKTIAEFVNNSVNYEGKSLSADVCVQEADVLFEDSNGNKVVDLEEKIISVSGFSPAKERIFESYKIVAGDNLWTIASRVNSSDVHGTLNSIIEANNLGDGSYIRPGQVLTIPSGRVASSRVVEKINVEKRVGENVEALVSIPSVTRSISNPSVESVNFGDYRVTESVSLDETDDLMGNDYSLETTDFVEISGSPFQGLPAPNFTADQIIVNESPAVPVSAYMKVGDYERVYLVKGDVENSLLITERVIYESDVGGKKKIVPSDVTFNELEELVQSEEMIYLGNEFYTQGGLFSGYSPVVKSEAHVQRQEAVYSASEFGVDLNEYSAPSLSDANTSSEAPSDYVAPSNIEFDDGEESLSLYDLFSMAGGSFRDVAVPDDERENYMRNYLNRQAGIEETEDEFPDAVTNGSLENILGEAYGTKVAVNSLYHNSEMSVREIQEQFKGVNIYEHIEGVGRKAKITGYVNERAEAVRSFYDNGEGMKVAELAEQYGVSTSTIRRDLKRSA